MLAVGEPRLFGAQSVQILGRPGAALLDLDPQPRQVRRGGIQRFAHRHRDRAGTACHSVPLDQRISDAVRILGRKLGK